MTTKEDRTRIRVEFRIRDATISVLRRLFASQYRLSVCRARWNLLTSLYRHPCLLPPFFPVFPLALLFIFLLELSDSYVQRKEAVLLADDAMHVLQDSVYMRLCVLYGLYTRQHLSTI